MITISEGLSAYRVLARAEGRSPRTIQWICAAMGYFRDFLGQDAPLDLIQADDLRRFIIACQDSPKYRRHPYDKPQTNKISPQSVETYARGIRAFFGHMFREGLIPQNPIERVRMPRVPLKVVPTFSAVELERLLRQPRQDTATGYRDYTLLMTFIDTGARLSEISELRLEDVNFEEGDLKVMGKGGQERYLPFGRKVASTLLKYKLKYRPQAVGTDHFFLRRDGRPLGAERIEKIVKYYGRRAGLKRCYPHKLRHSSSVIYLRNGGDPFSLQKKLGHRSLAMTRRYANLADADVRAKHLTYGVVDRLRT